MAPRRDQKGRALDWQAWFAMRAAETADADLHRYFEAGLPAPDTPVGQVPFVAMDMETTGLDHRREAIVSIGLVPFTLERIHFSRRFYRVLRPPRPLSGKSVTFHRITHDEIVGAPDLDTELGDILDAMAGRIPVVHYRGIERPFLDGAVQARRHEPLRFPVIDTLELEARLHRESFRSKWLRRLGGSPVSIRLHDSRARYNLPGYGAHHALTDALATAELLQAQIARHYSPETPLRQLWV